MKSTDVQVSDKDGNIVDARLLRCLDCDGSTFSILIIRGHTHLECSTCHVSFCQGGCE